MLHMPVSSKISYSEDKNRKEKGLACWKVNVPAKLSSSGKKKAFFFRSKQDAISKVRELQLVLNNEGARVLEITSPEVDSFFYARDNFLIYGVEFRRGVDVLIDLLNSGDSLEEIKEAYKEGSAIRKRRKESVSFIRAADEMIDLKQRILKRRNSTILQIKVVVNRVKRNSLWFRDRPLIEISPDDCRKMLDEAFNTPKQRDDARRVLSGVFTLGKKRGWCSENPMSGVERVHLEEREIKPLTVQEVKSLLSACKKPTEKNMEKGEKDFSSCIAPIAILTFGGVRPEEVKRLKWNDIDFEESVISIRGSASKTGGTRHVTMGLAMKAWLELVRKEGDVPICPPLWRCKWTDVRRKAGWKNGKKWQEDALRHTFASYHAKSFKDFALLQIEMGHSSSALLRQRYTNLSGVTEVAARAFWNILPPI